MLFGDQFDHIRNQHKGNKLPSVHVLGDFNFKDIDWPDRLKGKESETVKPNQSQRMSKTKLFGKNFMQIGK